ncbi:MAG: protein kinase domain-containing protein [Persicimonas sp.]
MTVEGYTDQKELAKGRMSTVVRAIEEATGRTVALKILHDHLVDEEPVRRRLRRELAALRRLDHPSIVRVDDLIEEGDTVALVMEYVEGESVRARVERDGPMEWEEAKPVLDSVLAGLEEAQAKGIWHRDLNADHVLIDEEGQGRIVGFGLARVDELVGLTMHTRVLGALEAMAPERVLGLDYDGRADLYSVGAVAHEMLCGHPPVDGTLQAAFSRAADERNLADDLPDDLRPQARYLLERSLVSDVGARFATPAQMRRALEGVYDEQLWRSWAKRQTDGCPECGTPTIEGLPTCIECGHEFRRLIQRPGDGDLIVEVITPKEAFEPDVWFEQNAEPDYLPGSVFNDLMGLLNSYEDTQHAADGDLAYRSPPYILFDGLTDEDAERISTLLDERSIPYRIHQGTLDDSPSALRRRIEDLFEQETDYRREVYSVYEEHQKDGSKVEYAFDKEVDSKLSGGLITVIYSIFVIPIVLLTSVDPKWLVAGFATLWMIVYALMTSTETLGLEFGVAAIIGFVAAAFATSLAVKAARRGVSRGGEGERIGGRRLMIPADSLESISTGGAHALPERTGSVLRRLGRDSVRREVHDVVVLAVSLARRIDDDNQASLEALVDRVLDVALRLDEAHERAEKIDTAELYSRLERLDARIDARIEALGDDQAAELVEERIATLEELDAHDEAVLEATHLSSTLQLARGALLDLRSSPEEEVVFDFDFGNPQDRLVDVRSYIEARTEVEEVGS